MSKRLDIKGKKFGRLSVLSDAGNDKFRRRLWLCVCDCGNNKVVAAVDLQCGKTRSCGCAKLERLAVLARTNVTHGDLRGGQESTEYKSWSAMKRRCLNPNSHAFERYGGRGIAVCDQWRQSFSVFLADMGRKPSSRHSLDRIDNNGNYEPENCRWATPKQQVDNRRPNRQVEI